MSSYQELEFKQTKGRISTAAPQILAYLLQSLRPILHIACPNSMLSYSKGSRGLFVPSRVIGIFTAAKAVEPLVYLHAGVLIIVKGTAGHAISFDLDPIKRCRISGADRLLDCFKYILCHVPLTAGLSHRGLVSGSFRTLTGGFAAFYAIWLPD